MNSTRERPWTAAIMMILSVLAVCVLVPMGFISAGSFSRWLESAGVHLSPNLAGGYPVVETTDFDLSLQGIPSGMDAAEAGKALAVRRFAVRKVAFRRFSGMGIAPRVNLFFEFAGQLPNPQNSPSGFSSTTIHVYMKTPSGRAGNLKSERAAKVDFEDSGWSHEVIIDGFHDQALIYDSSGNLVAKGLGLYVDHQDASRKSAGKEPSGARTTVTAALPLEYLGDPTQGDWRFYMLVGLSDSRDPSMMLHSAGARPTVYCAALSTDVAADARPRLRPLVVRN